MDRKVGYLLFHRVPRCRLGGYVLTSIACGLRSSQCQRHNICPQTRKGVDARALGFPIERDPKRFIHIQIAYSKWSSSEQVLPQDGAGPSSIRIELESASLTGKW